MGTRGFVGFVVDDVEKISYLQFDSYPEGVGVDVLHWLRIAIDSVPALRDAAKAIRLVDAREAPSEEEKSALGVLTDSRVSSGSDWYATLRKAQGKLDLYLRHQIMTDDHNFPLDSLFCEWGYLVDLDHEVFEVYRGFQTRPPISGRWKGGVANAEGYYAVDLAAVWPLSALPADDGFFARINATKEA